MLYGGDTRSFLAPPFNESLAIEAAVARGAFWGTADAAAAMDALRFTSFEQDVWAGGIPLELKSGKPQSDPRLKSGIPVPPYIQKRKT